MWHKEQLLFDLITRDAVLMWNGQLFRLDGPFASKEQAAEAAEELKLRLIEAQELAAA